MLMPALIGTITPVINANLGLTQNMSTKAPMKVMMAMKRSSGPW